MLQGHMPDQREVVSKEAVRAASERTLAIMAMLNVVLLRLTGGDTQVAVAACIAWVASTIRDEGTRDEVLGLFKDLCDASIETTGKGDA